MKKLCQCGNDTFTFEEKVSQGAFGKVTGTYLICTSCGELYEIGATRTYRFKEAINNDREKDRH